MGKKALKGLLTIILLSGVANASDENDAPNINKDEYISVSKTDLMKHKEQIDLLAQNSAKLDEIRLERVNKVSQELQRLTEQRFSELKQESSELIEQRLSGLRQQTSVLRQGFFELIQQNSELRQQNTRTNVILEQILQKIENQK